MEERSLGIFETNSMSSAINALSVIGRDKSISILNKQILGDGIVALIFNGRLGAMKQAFTKGAEHLSKTNEFRTFHLIPMPHKNLLSSFGIKG